MEKFPQLVYEKLFTFLSPSDLSNLSQCSIRLYCHCNDEHTWFHHCFTQNWIKFGMSGGSLSNLPSSAAQTMINISKTSPRFPLEDLDHEGPGFDRLPAVCKWRQVYLRAHHLTANWAQGRYIVSGLLRGHESGKISALDCNGRRIVSGGSDGVICSWSLSETTLLQSIKVGEGVCCLRLLADDRLFVGLEDGEVHLYDCQQLNLITNVCSHSSEVLFLEVIDQMLISVGGDNSIHLWDLDENRLRCRLEAGHESEVTCKCVCGDRYLATGSWDSTVILWDLSEGRQVRQYLGHTEAVSCIEVSKNRLVSASHDGSLRVWLLDSDECQLVLTGHKEVYCVALYDDMIISGGSDSAILVWTWSGECLHRLQGHSGIVRFLHVLSTGGSPGTATRGPSRLIVSAGDVRRVIVWDPCQGQLLATLHRNPSQVGHWWVSDTRIVLASPAQPGTLTVISFW